MFLLIRISFFSAKAAEEKYELFKERFVNDPDIVKWHSDFDGMAKFSEEFLNVLSKAKRAFDEDHYKAKAFFEYFCSFPPNTNLMLKYFKSFEFIGVDTEKLKKSK